MIVFRTFKKLEGFGKLLIHLDFGALRWICLKSHFSKRDDNKHWMELDSDSRMRIFLYKKIIENPTFAVIINCESTIYAHAWLAELFMEDKKSHKNVQAHPPTQAVREKVNKEKDKG